MTELARPVDDVLSVELERALLRALKAAWNDVNWTYFAGAMRAPSIGLASGDGKLGLWRREQRSIELSRRLVLAQPWGVVVEVLKHEVAHQYVHEVLGVSDETAHGPAFRATCERLGIDAAATGLPEAGAGNDDDVRVLRRIAKLLALADSQNEHEAQAAMAEAQRLMLKHNLEAAAGGTYRFRHLGRPTGRVQEHERILATLLCKHFFVEGIWVPVWRAREGKRGSVLEVCGEGANLEMAAYVHEYLLRTAERLWSEYDAERSRDGRRRRDRMSFFAGVMAGFREKLDAQVAVHREQGLVWTGDADLGAYYRRRHPRIRWTRHYGSGPTDAHREGKKAGREIVLSRPIASDAASRGRLLGPRS